MGNATDRNLYFYPQRHRLTPIGHIDMEFTPLLIILFVLIVGLYSGNSETELKAQVEV